MSQWLQPSPVCITNKVAYSININFFCIHYQHIISLTVWFPKQAVVVRYMQLLDYTVMRDGHNVMMTGTGVSTTAALANWPTSTLTK